MQHLRPGELIALENQGAYYIFVILSKSAFFGCQWSFALHQFYPRLPAFEEIQLSQSEGFVALIDFIYFVAQPDWRCGVGQTPNRYC